MTMWYEIFDVMTHQNYVERTVYHSEDFSWLYLKMRIFLTMTKISILVPRDKAIIFLTWPFKSQEVPTQAHLPYLKAEIPYLQLYFTLIW